MLKHTTLEYNSYIVQNAGVILLFPFLLTLFKNLDLLIDNKFNTDKEAIRAAILLEYLVYGDKKSHSDNLYLNKLLCNITDNTIIEYPIILTLKETNECDFLLKSVISHWRNLGKTSIDGLRESFLKRQGKLQIGEKTILTVERNGFDILLESLPWGISLIRLPWLPKPLKVNWF